ncbi:apolipoprotein N-acyltransferase [Microbulbifer halophilus]|uniref:Apolipoprotein N-acyltransferase n=1 Tax=Microbulbifer halophilus TaxID=453963 RepID=A0ABW5EE10_9GAMM|nr:apolipoprotein N-acyltransferase [Microbulbifer halophilus]MCW8127302.1 apolipoprotein N-acyltransferase [Microbulbifer halophilus]
MTVGRFTGLVLAAVSGLLLALPYNEASLFLLSWVGFVPLLLAARGASPAHCYFLGLVCGLALYGTGAGWIVTFIRELWSPGLPATIALSLVFWLYSAQLPALLLFCFRWLQRRSGWSELLLFPPLAAIFFAHFPMLFQAQLGESQSAFLVALQGVSLTGVYGLDLVLALVNLLLYRWLASGVDPWRDRIGWCAALLPLAWLGYGTLALNGWDQRIGDWPQKRLGFVQENGPAALERVPQPGHTSSYPRALALSRPLVRAGAELVVWPEAGFDRYFDSRRVAASLRRAADDMDAALLLQGMAWDNRRHYNSAVLLDAAGAERGRYRKRRRVAFGEYLPLLDSFPGAQRRARHWLGDFFSPVSPGPGPARFALGDATLLPLICYEAMFPRLVADAARGGRARELLVILSNNAWFGDSRQPFQHLNASVLRAVENRRPLLHAINNGPSAVILPSGRRLLQSEFGEEAGYWLDVPLPAAVAGGESDSFFTRHPRLLLRALYLLLLAALFRAFLPLERPRPLPGNTFP